MSLSSSCASLPQSPRFTQKTAPHTPQTPTSLSCIPQSPSVPTINDTPETSFLLQDTDSLVDACMAFLALRLPIMSHETVQELFSRRVSLSRCVTSAPTGGPSIRAMNQLGSWCASQRYTGTTSQEHMSLYFVWIICFLGMRCMDHFAAVPVHPYAPLVWANVVRLLPGTLQRRSLDSTRALAMTVLAVMPSKFGPVDLALTRMLAADVVYMNERQTHRMSGSIMHSCAVLERMAEYEHQYEPIMRTNSSIETNAQEVREVSPRILCTALVYLEQHAAAFASHFAAVIKLRTTIADKDTSCSLAIRHRLIEVLHAVQGTSVTATCTHSFCAALAYECSELRAWVVDEVSSLSSQIDSYGTTERTLGDVHGDLDGLDGLKRDALWSPSEWAAGVPDESSLCTTFLHIESPSEMDFLDPNFNPAGLMWQPRGSPTFDERSPYLW